MNSHCAWSRKEYGEQANLIPILIIPTKQLSYEADFSENVKIIRHPSLKKLKSKVQKFINNLHSFDLDKLSDRTLNELLIKNDLEVNNLKTDYSEDYYPLSRK